MEDYAPSLNRKEERVRKALQSQIKYCDYDQPYDGGDVMWLFGDKTDVYEMLSDYDISEASKEKIVAHLYCPGCGFDSFDLMSNVGIETAYERELDKHVKQASSLFTEQVISFERELELYPLLAMNNKLAKKIYKEIEKENLPITSVAGVFFRARRVESSEVFEVEKMYHAPLGKPHEGRFNHAGQSHLYLANDKETAIKEVIGQEKKGLVWIQEFLIEHTIDKILDLTFEWHKLSTSTQTLMIALNLDNTLRRADRNVGNWKPDYFITRFMMDCAKSFGYQGIKYNSAKGFGEFDLVLFYPEKISLVPRGKPAIEIFMDRDDREELPDLPLY